MVGGCGGLVVWDLSVVSESAWSVVGCSGSAVVLVPVVTGSFDVVGTWSSVVGTLALEVCAVTTTVVLKSVLAVVAVAVVAKVDGV